MVINTYPELKKIYQEGYRKYNKVENTPPQKVTMYSGWKTYGNNAYEKMSLNDWRNTFFKLNTKQRSFDDWNKPTKEGNLSQFKDHVAQDPIKFLPFIIEIVDERQIDIEYLISGLEGLHEGKCNKKDFEDLCLNIIKKRSHNFNDMNLSSFLRTLHYIVQGNKNLDKRIFEFIKQIIYKYPDRQFTYNINQKKDKGMDAITAGINSIRGIAVELMVECHELKQFENEIFETLEYVADNTTSNPQLSSSASFLRLNVLSSLN